MALPRLDPDDVAARSRHLLLLPADVGHDEVDVLATSRFPGARWEVEPSTDGSGRGGRGPVPPGVLRLSRHSVLVGPFTLDPVAAAALGVPTSAAVAYRLDGPTERGEAPWPGSGDRDGLNRAFPDGLPVRDEGRTVGWLVAAARRLGGAVRAVAGPDHAAVLVPDPAAAVDLTVWTDIWLEPDASASVMRRVVPRAALNLPTTPWSGPPRGTGQRPAPGTEKLDPDLRRALHAAADDRDIATLTEPPPMHAYGCLADLGLDGMLALEVAGETTLPPVIAAVPWAAQGAVAYRVRWEPADLDEHHRERPSLEHRVARGRATELVVGVTRALHAAVGGEITDEMDFVVDPLDL